MATIGNDTIYGSLGDDSLDGLAGDDYVLGLDGNDTLLGGDGADTVYGDWGDDQLYGGTGADRLIGDVGDDQLFGGNDDDYLDGGWGVDVMNGGLGNDVYIVTDATDTIVEGYHQGLDEVRTTHSFTLPDNVENGIVLDQGWSGVTLVGNALSNTLTGGGYSDNLQGGAGDDVITGGNGYDTLVGNEGSDILRGGDSEDVLQPGLGSGDRVDGGASLRDTLVLDYASLTDAIVIDTNTGAAQAGANHVSFANVEFFRITGGSGDDRLESGMWSDTLNGGIGADTLVGGAGGDTYYLDSSRDVVIEGTGTYAYSDFVFTSVSVTLAANVEGGMLTGSAVRLIGNDRKNTLLGTDGDNVLWAGAENDTAEGGHGADELAGGDGDDILAGNRDYIPDAGPDGSDTLTGGMGADFLTGDLSSDIFRFRDVAESYGTRPTDTYTRHFDRIGDFSHAEHDIIDLSAIDANSTQSGNQAFTLIGKNSFHHVAGELRQTTYDIGSSTAVLLEGDVNGDGVADFRIDFTDRFATTNYLGDYTFVASDFVL